jgi:hypothetical protein
MLDMRQFLQPMQQAPAQRPYWMTPPINPEPQGGSFTDPSFLLQLMRGGFGGGGAYANQNRGMPSFAGQARDYQRISPLERQNRFQMGYGIGQDYGNTPNPMSYTGLFAMSNPFWGNVRSGAAMQPGPSPAAIYGARNPNANMWRQSMMESLPGVMEDMDMNRTLTDWWPGAGPTFTRSAR